MTVKHCLTSQPELATNFKLEPPLFFSIFTLWSNC